jgi:hypothetical protein
MTRSLQGSARGAPPDEQPRAEAELDRAVLPALGVREAESGEGEVPDAPRAVRQEIQPRLIIAHLIVIGYGAVGL